MNFEEWLSTLPGAPTPTTAARKAGLVAATLIRHAKADRSTSDNVIAIARAYGVPPVAALVDTGHLTPAEASESRMDIRIALRRASLEEKWDAIADEMDGLSLTVEHWPRFSELSVSFEQDSDETAVDGHQSRHNRLGKVANRREVEPEEGDDDYGSGA